MLLTDKGLRNYPSDYLFSRLRGRIDRGIVYIRGSGTDAAREFIEQEYRWVYLQMNKELRRLLWPFFFYREIKRLFEWLRIDDLSLHPQLESSLLSEEIKKIFLGTRDLTSRIEKLKMILSDIFKEFNYISKNSELKAFEENLMKSFLSTIVTSAIYPALRDFFRYIIDFRNLVTIYKCIRWKLERIPSFTPCGKLSESELRRAFSSGDITMVNKLSIKRLGLHIDDPSEIEIGLYNGLRVILKRFYQTDPLKPIVIPYYLWNCYVEYLMIGT